MEIFNLTSPKKLIDSEKLCRAYKSGTLRVFENDNDVRVIVSDSKFIYVTDINTYEFRMGVCDIMLGMPPAETITLTETRIHTNETIDGIKYTWGNIYGANSILCGKKFLELVSTDTFKNIIGMGLKNVILRFSEGQYKLMKYEFRD